MLNKYQVKSSIVGQLLKQLYVYRNMIFIVRKLSQRPRKAQ